MDIGLPKIRGTDVVKWMRAQTELRDVIVLAVTAFAMKGDEQIILDAGCSAYASKPIAPRNFPKLVQSLLEKSTYDEILLCERRNNV